MKKTIHVEEFEHIGTIIGNVLKTCRNDIDENLTQVWDLWDRAVGDGIAQNARPAAFKGNLLLVNVTSSTWMHQLQFLKNDMIKQINQALGKELVKEIKFKIGPI
jgi:predicted nucleic acid-binding Zn ribbon protein